MEEKTTPGVNLCVPHFRGLEESNSKWLNRGIDLYREIPKLCPVA
jgi:hypothetical protein